MNRKPKVFSALARETAKMRPTFPSTAVTSFENRPMTRSSQTDRRFATRCLEIRVPAFQERAELEEAVSAAGGGEAFAFGGLEVDSRDMQARRAAQKIHQKDNLCCGQLCGNVGAVFAVMGIPGGIVLNFNIEAERADKALELPQTLSRNRQIGRADYRENCRVEEFARFDLPEFQGKCRTLRLGIEPLTKRSVLVQ